ncbi:glycoprotein [Prochlorococcus marinus XMU1414]|uniref:glycoprotein n=1 Tax=Prochlorococcus marinus TaxID=1219 RepID=UPI001ADBFD12|nr:glycoprotein [Prochlorococcus marinus]MBO8227740.1 glycoprotein [Prochlorococcus marinus XMU1414]
MLLKNHLIEVFKQASLENNFLLKENVVLKWVHRFGIDSLNDLLIHSSLQKENQHEEENQEQISLIDEVHEENQEQITLMDEVHEENQEQITLMDEEENQEQITLMDEEENQEQISLIDEVHEENQEQISLIDEVHEENQEQIKLELSKTFENIEEIKWESSSLETAISNEISNKNQNSNKINQFTETPKLPLPYIKNLRKWINNDKKAS